MGDLIESRWFKWDNWYNLGRYGDIVKEFDLLLKNNKIICTGDLSRRDSALEAMGIVSISKRTIEKVKNEKNT